MWVAHPNSPGTTHAHRHADGRVVVRAASERNTSSARLIRDDELYLVHIPEEWTKESDYTKHPLQGGE